MEVLDSAFEIEALLLRNDLKYYPENQEFHKISTKDFERISSFKNGDGYLAVVKIPKNRKVDVSCKSIYLDGIRDPGNLGTMIRTADWYGLTQVICSTDCVDCYNPKSIASAMGSLFRVSVVYDHEKLIEKGAFSGRLIGASLHGELAWNNEALESFVLVIGSESHGMRPEVEAACDRLVKLPGGGGAESLNAAVACGILLDRLYMNNR